MAKNSSLSCPFCGAKTTDDQGKYHNHVEQGTRDSLCPMSGRPVEGRKDSGKDDGPVVSGPSV
jgi:uncharacterized Zn-finger protein